VATNEWPNPSRSIATLHHAFHRFPMLVCTAAIVRVVTGWWPREELMA
jgi:hypothetical protein